TRQDFLIEAIYRTVAPAPRHLQMPRFLPATHFHLVLGPSVEDAWVEQEPNNDHTHTQALRQALEQNRDALHFIDRHDAARLVGGGGMGGTRPQQRPYAHAGPAPGAGAEPRRAALYRPPRRRPSGR